MGEQINYPAVHYTYMYLNIFLSNLYNIMFMSCETIQCICYFRSLLNFTMLYPKNYINSETPFVAVLMGSLMSQQPQHTKYNHSISSVYTYVLFIRYVSRSQLTYYSNIDPQPAENKIIRYTM